MIRYLFFTLCDDSLWLQPQVGIFTRCTSSLLLSLAQPFTMRSTDQLTLDYVSVSAFMQ